MLQKARTQNAYRYRGKTRLLKISKQPGGIVSGISLQLL